MVLKRSRTGVALTLGAAATVGLGVIGLVGLLATAPASAAPIPAPQPSVVAGNVTSCDQIAPPGDVSLVDSGGNAVSNTNPGVASGTLVNLDADAELEGLDVEVEVGFTLTAIAVKGGPDTNVYTFTPPAPGPVEVSGLVAPANASGTNPEISHWIVCGFTTPPTTATPSPTETVSPSPSVTVSPSKSVTPSPTTAAPTTATTTASTLPVTGTQPKSEVTGIIVGGLALIAAGAGLVFLRRRREASAD